MQYFCRLSKEKKWRHFGAIQVDLENPPGIST